VDLELGVETVRKPDGRALCSRNVHLGAGQAVYAAEPTITPDYLERRAADKPGATALLGVRGGAQSRNALQLQENRSCLGIHSPEPKGIR
jgi:hypothetical protein